MLLIDDGVIVSLDFSDSISHPNVGATFYRDKFNLIKTNLLYINSICFFFYFLDYSLVDKITNELKNFIVENIFSFFFLIGAFLGNNNHNNLNRRGNNNLLNLSNSNISLNSLISNDESLNEDENNLNNEQNHNSNNNRRNNRGYTVRNIFEDMLENMPCQ